jgi:hypothetical protein
VWECVDDDTVRGLGSESHVEVSLYRGRTYLIAGRTYDVGEWEEWAEIAWRHFFGTAAQTAPLESGGRKDDSEKNRVDLLPFDALEEVAKVLTFGARKYADRNWEKGMGWMRIFGGVMRHTWAWCRGENTDPESGLPHLAHAACDVLFLLTYELRKIGTDDRP